MQTWLAEIVKSITSKKNGLLVRKVRKRGGNDMLPDEAPLDVLLFLGAEHENGAWFIKGIHSKEELRHAIKDHNEVVGDPDRSRMFTRANHMYIVWDFDWLDETEPNLKEVKAQKKTKHSKEGNVFSYNHRTEMLWDGQRFSIRRDQDAKSSTGIYILDRSTGRTDWPIFYKDGKVGFDYPELLPWHIQQVTMVLGQEDSDLKEIRLQLALAFDFLDSLDHPKGKGWSFTAFWPHYIKLYNPEDWEDTNASVAQLWEIALSVMRRYGMETEIEQARNLQLGDLL